MINSGVPVIPGMMQAEADPDVLMKEAELIGYPVLIKAAAGGGGKGMRIVHSAGDFREATESASREAKSAFGNGAIYLEKYLHQPRHVEFQVLADAHGNVIHLLERECSIQRRHQKIIEETPSTALTPELREEMGKAAVAAARASGYVNAGTVEFLVDHDSKFYFLEVNTRLQVEHPITEMITGIDLVRQQIEIAAGNPLKFSQADIVGRGHAIECRIYAEDPMSAFLPSPGKIHFIKEPRGPASGMTEVSIPATRSRWSMTLSCRS
jgi:acetyl/propionyl-CoA carboxylase alpha subunit